MLKVTIDASTEPEVVRNTHLSEEASVAPVDDNEDDKVETKDNKNTAGNILSSFS